MIYCKKENISLCFDEKTAEILSVSDGVREYVGDIIPIFEAGLRDKAGDLLRICANELLCVSVTEESDGFSCIYSGKCGLEVQISAKITENICWRASLKASPEYAPEWISYPQIAVKNDLKDCGGKGKILWGFNEGVLVESMEEREKHFPYIEPNYPTVSVMGMYPAIVETQFMAYYNEESGMYFGAHDVHDCLKGVDFYRYKNSIKLQIRHFCGADFGEAYALPYPTVMQFFKGDWHDGADIYRDWFYKEKRDKFVPIAENKKLPAWYGESPVVITYPVRGTHDLGDMTPNKLFPYINVMPHVERLEREFGSKIMVLLMHWEGSAPWAPPYVWPPFGGEEELYKLIRALHERGDILGVYCSGLGWTEQSNVVPEYNKKQEFEEKGLKSVMCLSPKQELPHCRICTGQRRGYDMCPTEPFVKNLLKKEVKSMVDAGIDYVQLMDQNHGGTSHFCYSRAHNHPPVPGKWQVDAVKELYGEVFGNCGKTLFGCESAAAEAYIPYLLFSDNRFLLNYQIGTPVPLYAYLFHEYVNNFMGNQVNINFFFDNQKSPDNILMRTAYAFSAGDMLTAVLNQEGEIVWNWGRQNEADKANLPDREDITKLIKNLNGWRPGEFKKYLHTGKMLKPYAVNCGKNFVYTHEGTKKEFDKIFTCAWESSENTFGQFLINYNRCDISCTVDLPSGSWRIYKNENEYDIIEGGRQEIEIAALSAVLLEK